MPKKPIKVMCPACLTSNTFEALEIDKHLALKCVKCKHVHTSSLKKLVSS